MLILSTYMKRLVFLSLENTEQKYLYTCLKKYFSKDQGTNALSAYNRKYVNKKIVMKLYKKLITENQMLVVYYVCVYYDYTIVCCRINIFSFNVPPVYNIWF